MTVMEVLGGTEADMEILEGTKIAMEVQEGIAIVILSTLVMSIKTLTLASMEMIKHTRILITRSGKRML